MTTYSVVSEKQQVKMSRILSELMSGNVHSLEKKNSSQVGECSSEIPSASSAAEHHQQAMSLFTGVVGSPISLGEVFLKEVQKAKSTGFRL